MAMSNKLVSIITPTILGRRKLLLERCIPSVAKQTYQPIEHVVVQDGGETETDKIDGVTFIQMGRNWRKFVDGRSIGGVPRKLGTMVARGEYFGYLDDDDEFLPQHVEKLVKLLEDSGKDFVFSRFDIFKDGNRIGSVGSGKVEFGHIGTPMVIHRAHCLLKENWKGATRGEDYNLFSAWVNAGLTYAYLPEVTINVHRTPRE